MSKAELQQQAVALVEQLSAKELEVVVDLLTDIQKRQAGDTVHPVDPEAEIALEKILKDYDRAWKTLAKNVRKRQRTDEGLRITSRAFFHTDLVREIL